MIWNRELNQNYFRKYPKVPSPSDAFVCMPPYSETLTLLRSIPPRKKSNKGRSSHPPPPLSMNGIYGATTSFSHQLLPAAFTLSPTTTALVSTWSRKRAPSPYPPAPHLLGGSPEVCHQQRVPAEGGEEVLCRMRVVSLHHTERAAVQTTPLLSGQHQHLLLEVSGPTVAGGIRRKEVVGTHRMSRFLLVKVTLVDVLASECNEAGRGKEWQKGEVRL